MKRVRKSSLAKLLSSALLFGFVGVPLGGQLDAQAQVSKLEPKRVCVAGRLQRVSARSSTKQLRRILAAAKSGRLSSPSKSGKCPSSNLGSKTNRKSVMNLQNLLNSILNALATLSIPEPTPSPEPTQSEGITLNTPQVGELEPPPAEDDMFWFADQAMVPLGRANFVMTRDNIRGVVNRFSGFDPLGETIFNVSYFDNPNLTPEQRQFKIYFFDDNPQACFKALENAPRTMEPVGKDPIRFNRSCNTWRRVLSDMDARVDADVRIIPSPSYTSDIKQGLPGTVQINQVVIQRASYEDGTLLAVHAPSDNLELLMSYGDSSNPNSVVRLPILRLHEKKYDVVSGNRPASLVRDSTGQQYWIRDLVGLGGRILGRLEYPVGGKKDGYSKIVFKAANIQSTSASSMTFVSSGSGLAITALGAGYLEVASIQLPSRYGFGVFASGFTTGMFDGLTSMLRRIPLYTNLIPNAEQENSSIVKNNLGWRFLRREAQSFSVTDITNNLVISDL